MKQEIDAKLPAIQTEYARSIVQQLLNLDAEARPSMMQLKQVLDENYYIELGIEEHEDSFGEMDVCEEKSITMMRADDISLSKAAKVAPRDTKVNMERSLFESEKFDISGDEPPAKPPALEAFAAIQPVGGHHRTSYRLGNFLHHIHNSSC